MNSLNEKGKKQEEDFHLHQNNKEFLNFEKLKTYYKSKA